jgi:integrase
LPLFTGCLSRTRIWKPGQYFIQSDLYWAYIIALMTGMRPGEIGQLRVSDLEKRGAKSPKQQEWDSRSEAKQERHCQFFSDVACFRYVAKCRRKRWGYARSKRPMVLAGKSAGISSAIIFMCFIH